MLIVDAFRVNISAILKVKLIIKYNIKHHCAKILGDPSSPAHENKRVELFLID